MLLPFSSHHENGKYPTISTSFALTKTALSLEAYVSINAEVFDILSLFL
jgi:hypothetical protein